MARNPSLLGWLFGSGGTKRRKPSPTRKPAAKRAAPKQRKVPSIRTGTGPSGAATAKIARSGHRPKALTARQRAALEQAAQVRRFESGRMSQAELRDFLKTARTARNPAAAAAVRRMAERQSEQFHGPGFRDVVELSAAEQRRYGLPKYVVPLGRKNAIEYVAPPGSARAGAVWRHRATDRGRGKAPARSAQLLVADPRTGRAATIGGAERFTPSHGLVG